MPRSLYIVGAGGHGREILDVVEAINEVVPIWRFEGFVSDGPGDSEALARRGSAVVVTTSELSASDATAVIAIGDGATRRQLDHRLGPVIGPSPVLVHPATRVDPSAELDEGALVPAGSRIGPRARIGRHSTLNVNVEVGSDCRLGRYVTLSPGARIGDGAQLMDGVLVGIGAEVSVGANIGCGAVVGAGARVGGDVPDGAIVVGDHDWQ